MKVFNNRAEEFKVNFYNYQESLMFIRAMKARGGSMVGMHIGETHLNLLLGDNIKVSNMLNCMQVWTTAMFTGKPVSFLKFELKGKIANFTLTLENGQQFCMTVANRGADNFLINVSEMSESIL